MGVACFGGSPRLQPPCLPGPGLCHAGPCVEAVAPGRQSGVLREGSGVQASRGVLKCDGMQVLLSSLVLRKGGRCRWSSAMDASRCRRTGG